MRGPRIYGWRDSCYKRWLNAGRPNTGPPPPVPATAETARRALLGLQRKAAARREDYHWLRTEQEHTRQQAAWRMRVSLKQTYEWDRQLAAAGASP